MRNMIFAAACLVAAVAPAAIVRPTDDGRALVNPGMGWTMHYYSNIPENYGSFLEPGDACDGWPGCSVCYLRIPWAYLEPEEGVYNWSAIDTPAQRWIAQGQQIAFRITCSEHWMRFATPAWVMKAGAKGTFYTFGKGPDPKGDSWDPDFGDPVFLRKLETFVKAFARRYDGRREVAFVDIGSYGLWGEGHTFMSSQPSEAKRAADLKRHIDLWCRYFPRTQLVISDDIDGHDNQSGVYPLLDYARAKGVTWRDDSIMVQPPPKNWYHTDQAQRYWRTLPVVLEHEHLDPSLRNGAWNDALWIRSVEEMHASYMSIHGNPYLLLKRSRAAIDTITRRLGYRFQLREVSWPDEVAVGSDAAARPFDVSWSWANAGVAPPYRDFHPCLTVKDAKGRIMAVLADAEMNLRDLPVAAPGKAAARTHTASFFLGRWLAPRFTKGTFDVYVSVGEADGTPVAELPLGDCDGQRRYRIGKVVFK